MISLADEANDPGWMRADGRRRRHRHGAPGLVPVVPVCVFSPQVSSYPTAVKTLPDRSIGAPPGITGTTSLSTICPFVACGIVTLQRACVRIGACFDWHARLCMQRAFPLPGAQLARGALPR